MTMPALQRSKPAVSLQSLLTFSPLLLFSAFSLHFYNSSLINVLFSVQGNEFSPSCMATGFGRYAILLWRRNVILISMVHKT